MIMQEVRQIICGVRQKSLWWGGWLLLSVICMALLWGLSHGV